MILLQKQIQLPKSLMLNNIINMKERLIMGNVKQILKLTALAIIIATSSYSLAQEYIVPLKGPVTASISDKGVNRISVENDRIAHVIGNEEEYIIESDANLGQIFLSPALKSIQEISLRLLTESERTIDVKFIVKKLEPQTIIFKYNSEAAAPVYNLNPTYSSKQMTPVLEQKNISNNQNQVVIDAIKLVNSNKLKALDIPILGCLNQNSRLKGIKLVKASQYSFAKQMLVITAEMVNKNKTPVLLEEQDFSNCIKFTNAVALTKNQLALGEATILYLVGKDGK